MVNQWNNRLRSHKPAATGIMSVAARRVLIGVKGTAQDDETLLEFSTVRAEPPSVEPRRAELGLSAELVSEDKLRVVIETHRLDPGLEPERLTAWVAIVENDLVTSVGRGENASKTLRNDRVVRHLEQVSGPGRAVLAAGASLEIALQDGWRNDRLTVVAFLQEADSLRIRAAAQSRAVN